MAICKRPRKSSQVAESVIHPCRVADHQGCMDAFLLLVPGLAPLQDRDGCRMAMWGVKTGGERPFLSLIQCSAVVGLLGCPTPLSECYLHTYK